MIRFLHMVAISGLIGSAAYAYTIKYDTLFYAEEVAKIRAKLGKERDAIAVSKAEWALLERPDRLQRMADQNLDLQPMSINQLARFADLPVRPANNDEIGRKLEALGLDPPTATATPKDKRAAGTREGTPTRTPSR